MPKYLSLSMTCIPLLFMRVLLMFYRSSMLIITHVYIRFFCSCRIKGNLCTACIHTEMCVRSLLFFLSLSLFHFVYSMHFSYSSDSLILLESFFLSLSRPVCLSFCHCCCLMKFRYVLNHDACSIPFPHNTHIYTQQIHANCFDSCLGTV